MKYLQVWESFGESAVEKLTSLDFSNWGDEHEFDYFSKKDALIAFEILGNLDESFFGSWRREFPFNGGICNFEGDRYLPGQPTGHCFKGKDLDSLSSMPPYYFERDKFYSIMVESSSTDKRAEERKGGQYNAIIIQKFKDEWYTVNIYSRRYGELCYLCDSLEGLREIITIVENLSSKEWEIE